MFVPIYPVTRDADSVKATYTYGSRFPYYATDPTKFRAFTTADQWLGYDVGNKFNVDLGRPETITRLMLNNYTDSGGSGSNNGILNFTVYGSNVESDFLNTTYADDESVLLGMDLLSEEFVARPHPSNLIIDAQYFTFENTTAYRYYILRIHGAQSGPYLGFNYIEFQKNVAPGHSPVFLPKNDDAHVKATSSLATGYRPYDATNRDGLNIGPETNNSIWYSLNPQVTNQKFSVDLGSPKVCKKLYLENLHISGGSVANGIKNFNVYGTNSATAFALVETENYNDLTDLTLLTPTGLTALQHTHGVDNHEPQVFELDNELSYRYYVLRIADNYGGVTFMGFRKIAFLDEHVSHYPLIVNPTTIMATTNSATAYQGARRFSETTIEWESTAATNQKFIVDYGDGNAFAATRLMLENSHNATFAKGINSFAIYGSNSAPSTDYATDAGLVQLASGLNAVASTTTNEHETQYFDFSNTTEYRYYVLKVASNLGDGSTMNIAQAEFHGAGGAGPTPGADSDAIFFGCNF